MEYHFKPPSKTCATTGRPLAPGAICHSVLIEKNGTLTRLDYSEEGWRGPPNGHFGYWKTVVPMTADAKSQRLDPESALRYFEQLCEEASPETVRSRYVLALLLLQQRKLRLDDSRMVEETEILELSGKNGEGSFEVENLKLSEEESQQIQAELKAQLATEWT
jgi:hypothetical protein